MCRWLLISLFFLKLFFVCIVLATNNSGSTTGSGDDEDEPRAGSLKRTSKLPEAPSSTSKLVGNRGKQLRKHTQRRRRKISASERLLRFLMAQYWKETMPDSESDEPLLVTSRIFPIKLLNLYDKNEVLEATIRLQLSWRDPQLSWEPSKFGNKTSIVVAQYRLWMPDLQIANSASDLYSLLRDDKFGFKLHADGSVWWHPTGNVLTRCELNLKYFPFDHQYCPVIVESAISTTKQLNLTLRPGRKPVSRAMFVKSGNWELVGVNAKATALVVSRSTSLARVEYWLHICRETSYFKLNIIFPCVMLSSLQLLTFFFPLESQERVPHATSILLSVIVFQSMIVDQLPRSSDSIPLLCVYVAMLTTISIVAVVESVLIAGLVSCKKMQTVAPSWSRSFFRFAYACSSGICGINTHVHQSGSDQVELPLSSLAAIHLSMPSLSRRRSNHISKQKSPVEFELQQRRVTVNPHAFNSMISDQSEQQNLTQGDPDLPANEEDCSGNVTEPTIQREESKEYSSDVFLIDWLGLARFIDVFMFSITFMMVTVVPIVFFGILPPDK